MTLDKSGVTPRLVIADKCSRVVEEEAQMTQHNGDTLEKLKNSKICMLGIKVKPIECFAIGKA
jgi:predicted metal-binding protein